MAGETETEMEGAEAMLMAALADFVESAREVARRVTVAGAGTPAGAVYVTEVVVGLLRVPQLAPEQPAPERDQVTPLFRVSF